MAKFPSIVLSKTLPPKGVHVNGHVNAIPEVLLGVLLEVLLDEAQK